MALEEKLRKVVGRAVNDGVTRLRRHRKHFAGEVARILRDFDESWKDRDDARFNSVGDEARDAADLIDAAMLIKEKVLDAERGKIVEMRLRPDLGWVREEILSMFESGEARQRGFVYVAWSQRPEVFYYVGKAQDASRLNLAAHGNLAAAAMRATTLSLIFPAQSREQTLLDVEASAIRLVEDLTGKLPENNKRREKVPLGPGSAILDALADFLRKRGDSIRGSG